MTKKLNKNYTVKAYKNGKEVYRLVTHRKRLFLRETRLIRWRELKKNGGQGKTGVYLKIYYGRFMDMQGKMSRFCNEGFYKTRKSFWLALRAFDEFKTEDDL
jgi:hypothetical protein